jgi:hypothetical protein
MWNGQPWCGWEAGKSEPLAWVWPKLAAALKITPEELTGLFAEDSHDGLAAATYETRGGDDGIDRRGVLKAVGVGDAGIGGAMSVRDLVLDSARTSAMLRASVETPGISRMALASARQRLYEVATNYALTSDLTLLRELVQLRDEFHRLVATRRHHPGDTQELYALVGATCALLSSISHDLSEPNAAMIHATTAETFAELAGHSGLLTWIHCTKAMIASWWATPAEVLQHVHKAQAVGAVGISAIRLSGLQARAFAQRGMKAEAIAALNGAYDQREKLDDHYGLEEFGKTFTFPLARQHYYNSATHLNLGNWSAVEQETAKVATLYESATAGQTWPVTLTLSRIYQARAILRTQGLEGLVDTLIPVFDMPARQRIPQISHALNGVQKDLSARPYATMPAARHLCESIGFFQQTGKSS